MCLGVLPTFSMSPVRMHFWQVAARLKFGSPRPMNSRLNWFIPAGVNRTVASPCGTRTSEGFRTHPLEEDKSRYSSRNSSVVMAGLGPWIDRNVNGVGRLGSGGGRHDGG